MNDSAMNEIRKIRDENSKRHKNMTREERIIESNKSLDWFLNSVGRTKDDTNNKGVMYSDITPNVMTVNEITEEYN